MINCCRCEMPLSEFQCEREDHDRLHPACGVGSIFCCEQPKWYMVKLRTKQKAAKRATAAKERLEKADRDLTLAKEEYRLAMINIAAIRGMEGNDVLWRSLGSP